MVSKIKTGLYSINIYLGWYGTVPGTVRYQVPRYYITEEKMMERHHDGAEKTTKNIGIIYSNSLKQKSSGRQH